MPTYNYNAVDQKGKKTSGVIQSDTSRSARALLKEKGLIVSNVELVDDNNSSGKAFLSGFKKPISSLELSLITRQFAILLNSGLSVDKALSALIDQLETPDQKTIMMGVKNEVLGGRSLANSMKIFPKVFPPVYTSLINAGEQSGSLGKVMTKLADHSDKTRDLTSKIMMALLYPVIVSIVAVIMIIALLTFVVPQVTKVFETSHQTLPLITRIMIATSNGLRSYGWIALVVLAVVIFSVVKALQKEEYKVKFHRNLLKIPVAGKLLINVDVARFTNILSLLLSSGVPMIAALHAARDTVSNYMMKIAIEHTITSVQQGVSLAVALKKEDAFPPVVIHLIASGEKSGNLDHLLEQAGSHQELELSHRSQLLTGILEPLLILVMGGVVLMIVIAIMLPILNLNKTIN